MVNFNWLEQTLECCWSRFLPWAGGKSLPGVRRIRPTTLCRYTQILKWKPTILRKEDLQCQAIWNYRLSRYEENNTIFFSPSRVGLRKVAILIGSSFFLRHCPSCSLIRNLLNFWFNFVFGLGLVHTTLFTVYFFILYLFQIIYYDFTLVQSLWNYFP